MKVNLHPIKVDTVGSYLIHRPSPLPSLPNQNEALSDGMRTATQRIQLRTMGYIWKAISNVCLYMYIHFYRLSHIFAFILVPMERLLEVSRGVQKSSI